MGLILMIMIIGLFVIAILLYQRADKNINTIKDDEIYYDDTLPASKYQRKRMDIKVDKTSTILLYILSFVIPLAGFIVGAIYLSKDEEHYKHIGKNCLILSLMNIVLGFIMVAAILGSM